MYRRGVLSYFISIGGDEIHFVGEVRVDVAREERGSNGFAYDTILEVNGKTMAEMTSEEKNEISHRGLAMKKLINYLSGSERL